MFSNRCLPRLIDPLHPKPTPRPQALDPGNSQDELLASLAPPNVGGRRLAKAGMPLDSEDHLLVLACEVEVLRKGSELYS